MVFLVTACQSYPSMVIFFHKTDFIYQYVIKYFSKIKLLVQYFQS